MSSNYLIDVLYNTNLMSMLYGYMPGDKLEFQCIMTIPGDDISGVVDLGDKVFSLCNRGTEDDSVSEWLPRSMSVGDVIRIHDWPCEYMTCTPKGWEYVTL
jgi:hypothetical protein